MSDNRTNEIKKKRYPTDRLRLRAMLEKKEAELLDLEVEVQELRERVKQADYSAINATAAMYHVTPELFEKIMQAMNGGHGQVVPPLPPMTVKATARPVPDAEPDFPDEEDDSIDIENA